MTLKEAYLKGTDWPNWVYKTIALGVLSLIGITVTVAVSEWVKSKMNARGQVQIVTGPDGNVNINGAFFARFMESFEKQVQFQERQTTLQESMQKLMAQQNEQLRQGNEALLQHEAEAAKSRAAIAHALELLLKQSGQNGMSGNRRGG